MKTSGYCGIDCEECMNCPIRKCAQEKKFITTTFNISGNNLLMR